MTGPAQTVLSVRGDARLEVPPDLASLACMITVYESDKASALAAAARAEDALLSDLRELGGVARTASADRLPLTWLARSARTFPEYEHTERKGRVRTGRIVATVTVQLNVRDFALLDQVGRTLARHGDLHVNHVSWTVDHDNAAWPQVRAQAIEVAIQQGRDYATALGGSLVSVDHVADAGLLGNGGTEQHAYGLSARASASRSSDDEGDSPSLDPEPIELRAVIEARFTASVRPLG